MCERNGAITSRCVRFSNELAALFRAVPIYVQICQHSIENGFIVVAINTTLMLLLLWLLMCCCCSFYLVMYLKQG